MAAKDTISCEACFAGATYQIRDWIQQTAVSVKYGFSDPDVWAQSLDKPVDWTVAVHVEDGMATEAHLKKQHNAFQSQAECKDEEHNELIGAGGSNSALPTPCNTADDAASPLVAERPVAQVVVSEVLPAPATLLSCGAAPSVCSIIPEGGQEAARSLVEHIRGNVAGALPHVLSAAALALRAAQDSLFQISSGITSRCRESAQLLQDVQQPQQDDQEWNTQEDAGLEEGPKKLLDSQVKAPALWRLREVREKAQLADSWSQEVASSTAKVQAGEASSCGHHDDSAWLQEQTELHTFLAKFQETKKRSHEPAFHGSTSSSKGFHHVPERGVSAVPEQDMPQDLLDLHQFLVQSQQSKQRCFIPSGGETRCTSHLAGGQGRHVATPCRGLPLQVVQRPTRQRYVIQ